MNIITLSIVIGITAIVVAAVYAILKKNVYTAQLKNADAMIHDTMEKSRKESQDILSKAHRDAQEIINRSRVDIEQEVKSRRQAITEIESRIMQKEKHLDEREAHFDKKEEELEQEKERIKDLKKKQEGIVQNLLTTLEQTAGFSKEEAKKILLENVEKDMRSRAGKMIKDMEEQARKIANRKAKEIVTNAIYRTAIDHISSLTTSVVQLPDDEMKGRIIGKEGRNIRAFEAYTGVDVIIDDTPGAVILSAFDPIRREIATMALGKLVQDGRIHPTRIEETVEKSRTELEEIIKERGEKAAETVGLQFHPEIIKLLGKLHYRTSYGQNQLTHAIESSIIAGLMAEELGVNVQLAKRGALLHDIGKAIDFETEGSHDDLGKEICEKYGESQELINCIMAHHEDEEPDTIEAIIVMMADAISSVRPGARRESLQSYIKRLEKLEAIANSFEGVEKAFAIQAGREIRVMVKPEEVDDPAAHKLALDMAKKIENEVDYPGEVKISVIRETRAVGLAK